MDDQIFEILALCACLAAGIVFCFFGNRWLKVILAVYGFFVGFGVGHTLLTNLTALKGIELMLGSAGVGILVALLFVFLLYLGIFLIGFGGGVLLSLLIVDVLNLSVWDWYVYVAILVVGCILGTLTLNLRRIFVSIFTSFIGASMLALGIYRIATGDSTPILSILKDQQVLHSAYSSVIYLVSLAALFFIGLIIQLTVTSRKKTVTEY
jgi:hypothetical protein